MTDLPAGTAGTRNLLGIVTTVQCAAGVLKAAVERIKRELLPKYPNVDGVRMPAARCPDENPTRHGLIYASTTICASSIPRLSPEFLTSYDRRNLSEQAGEIPWAFLINM